MSELHLNHYDDEPFFTIEAHDSDATNILKALDATHIRDSLYRLPVSQVVPFLAQRFKLDVTGHTHRHVTEAQREARRRNMAKARMNRRQHTAN